MGDGACVGAGAYIVGHEFTRNGKMKRGPVNVGAGCTIGLKARLGPHVTATAGSKVPALTSAMTGETFSDGKGLASRQQRSGLEVI